MTSTSPAVHDVDVVVVGARVAGAATAMLLARAGHSVALVDRVRMPNDTLSTHAISRSGVVQLYRWGVLDDVLAAGTPPVRDVSFHSVDGVVARRIRASAGVDHLIAPRRHVLDPILVDAAERAGALVHCGTTVRSVTCDPSGRVTGVRAETDEGAELAIRARHVVGADGLRSTVAANVGAAVVEEHPSTASTHYVYVSGLDAVGFEYHVSDGAMSGVFITNDDEACVWVCCPAERADPIRRPRSERAAEFMTLLAECAPELAARVRSARVTSPVRGVVRLPNRVLQAAGDGWWLVGDAGYHRDPVTGHGISDAFRDAELLAESIDRHLIGEWTEGLARTRYIESHRRALQPLFDVTCEMATFPPRPRFVALQRRLSDLIEAEATRLANIGPRPWTAVGCAVPGSSMPDTSVRRHEPAP